MTNIPPTNTPIVVNAKPAVDQINAAVRAVIIAAATVATTLGYAKLGGEINGLLQIAGPIIAGVTIVIGQLKTRKSAVNQATMANLLPDDVAQVKGN